MPQGGLVVAWLACMSRQKPNILQSYYVCRQGGRWHRGGKDGA